MTWFRRWFPEPIPPLPAPQVHEACGGAIRVTGAPADRQWGRQEDEDVREGGHVRVLRYTLHDGPAAMTLVAEVTTLDSCPDPVTDAGWKDELVALFLEMDEVVVSEAEQPTLTAPLAAREVEALGTSPSGWPIALRERRAVRGNQRFIVRARGPLGTMEGWQGVVDAWFAHTAFAPADA